MPKSLLSGSLATIEKVETGSRSTGLIVAGLERLTSAWVVARYLPSTRPAQCLGQGYAAEVQRLDQVIFWLEAGRVVVQVDYFDALGKLRKELFHRPTGSPVHALEAVALELAERGIGGKARVRKKQGSNLVLLPELQQHFLRTLEENLDA